MELILSIFFLILAYISGSIPSGVIIAKWAKGIDPRTAGSNNPGSTNVARLCGFKYGIMTLIGDLFKGLIPVALAMQFISNPLLLSMVALCAIFGHLKSIFLGFEGGKGVATLLGSLLPLIFPPMLMGAIICLFVIWRSEFVSLGALSMATALPIFCILLGYFAYIPLTLVTLVILFWTHRANIERLARNEEKLWRSKKEKTA